MMSDKTNDNPFDLKPLTIEVTYDTPFKYIFAVPNETEEILTQLLNDLLCLEGPKKIIELKLSLPGERFNSFDQLKKIGRVDWDEVIAADLIYVAWFS